MNPVKTGVARNIETGFSKFRNATFSGLNIGIELVVDIF